MTNDTYKLDMRRGMVERSVIAPTIKPLPLRSCYRFVGKRLTLFHSRVGSGRKKSGRDRWGAVISAARHVCWVGGKVPLSVGRRPLRWRRWLI
jgi:hypothetical protein